MTAQPTLSLPFLATPRTIAAPAPMVLHVRVVTGSGGGPDKTVMRSPAYVDPDRLRMAAAYIHPAGDKGIELLRQRARQWRCPLFTIPESSAIDLNTVRSLLDLCRRLQVAIWHGHDYKSNLLGLLLRRFWPMQLVTTVHGWTWESRRMRLYERLDRALLKHYDHVIAVSPLLRDQVEALGVEPSRLSYIANAIVPSEYVRQQSPAQARHNLAIAKDDFVIGVVGRLGPEKGVDRAIRALAALLPRHPQLHLHIVGDGPERNSLVSLAREFNVHQHVHFHGWQAQSQPFYEAMDMLLLPSHTEGLPNVVLEAMAMQVPVAATSVGGVPDLLDHGRCGVVLDQVDTAWPQALDSLISDRMTRLTFAARARQRIETDFSFHRRMQKVFGVYDQLLAPYQTLPSQDGVVRRIGVEPARQAA
jgi:glycosyltransferase involved in cell wall biosynthesis